MLVELLPLFMFVCVCAVLLLGYPVAFSLSGTALLFALIGSYTGNFETSFLVAFPSRMYGMMLNQTLLAVPLFVFMGVMLERAKVAENLLDTMGMLFGPLRGGLGVAVICVGMLLAASTGIVGATVVTMGLLSLPTMLKRKYDPCLATGIICASGTLGQIIPPSIVLVLLGDILSAAYQQAQLNQGIFTPETVSVGDLFIGALLPGLLLVAMYITYVIVIAWLYPERAPAIPKHEREYTGLYLWKRCVQVLIPPLLLIVMVLGAILTGFATPTEAAAVGAIGATLLAIIHRQLNLMRLRDVMRTTTQITSMVFLILIGASIFSIVFRGFGGDDLVASLLEDLPGGAFGAMVVVMVIMFLLGFILDFIEITFVVVPIVGPILLSMGINPIWLGVMIALNLQTSFLTPPFGFALFYLRGVAPESVTTGQIYRGVMPFIALQLLLLMILGFWPTLATWLPTVVYAS